MILLDLAPADWIGIAAIAIPTLGGIAYLVYSAGGIVTLVKGLKDDVDGLKGDVEGLKGDVQGLKRDVQKIPGIELKLASIEGRLERLWRGNITSGNSPMILNDVGVKILNDSKMDELLRPYYSEILRSVKALNPSNPFQAQEILISVVNRYKLREDCKDKLEVGAYNSGHNVDTVLFVGAINIRDQIVMDLGFNLHGIDKNDPTKNPAKKEGA